MAPYYMGISMLIVQLAALTCAFVAGDNSSPAARWDFGTEEATPLVETSLGGVEEDWCPQGGKQLTLKFYEGKGDDPVYSPDLMKYAILDLGSQSGSLSSALTVPPAASRRIDVYYRHGTEYTPANAAAHYRTDQVANRPAWWTPEGGPMPEQGNPAMTMYDN